MFLITIKENNNNNDNKCSCDLCPDPVYFDTRLLIIYLSGIEILIFHIEIVFKRVVYFLRFCTKYDTRFSKYRIELIVALSWTNATKRYFFLSVICPVL